MNKRYGAIFVQLGYILNTISVMLLLPLISLLWFPNELMESINFIIPSLIAFGFGQLLLVIFKKEKTSSIKKANQVLIVVFAWFLACVFLSLPFVFNETLNFTQAFFEASSGLSTTGLSVVDVSSVPKIYLMHRSFIQFYGGIGIVLILVTIFVNGVGFELYMTEGHNDRLNANAKSSARIIVKLYTLYIFLGFIALILAKIPSFDALNIAMASVATGGFGVTPHGIADYNSHAVNIIVIVLMIIGSISFYTHSLIVKKKFKKIAQIDELQLFFKLIVFFIFIAFFISISQETLPIYSTFETITFEVVSAISGTGFSLVDYSEILLLNQTLITIVILAMIIGGAIGSTSGGIKVTRLNMALKSLKWNNQKLYSSSNKLIKRTTITPYGKQVIRDNDLIYATNYILLYLIILVIGTLIFTIFGFPLVESFFEFSSALGNVGLTNGITSPDLNPILLWVLSISMFVGRLEIFVVIGVLTRIFKRKKRKCKITDLN